MMPIQLELGNYLYERLRSVPNIRIYGPAPSETVQRAALCSFNVEDIHPTDIATFLDQQVRYYIKTTNVSFFQSVFCLFFSSMFKEMCEIFCEKFNLRSNTFTVSAWSSHQIRSPLCTATPSLFRY